MGPARPHAPGLSSCLMPSPIILPEQYDSTASYDLLREAERARLGFDCRLLRSLIARRDETVAALLRIVEIPAEDRMLDIEEQCFDLCRHFRAPEAVPFYLRLLRGNPAEIPDALVEAFAELGAPALDAVLELHDTLGDDDRADVVFLLAAMGVRDERVRRILETTLARDPYEGALSLGLYSDPALRPSIEQALAALPESSREERKALADCLQQLDSKEAPRAPEAFDVFELYPETSLPMFGVLKAEDVLPFLTCGSVEYRIEAALSFCHDDYSSEVRDALVRMAESDQDAGARGAALRALGEKVDDHQVVALLEQRLEDEPASSAERFGALVALAGVPDSKSFRKRLSEIYEIEDGRAPALEAMWRSLDPRYTKYFASNLRHQDREVRSQAIQGVGAFPIPALAIELVPFFQDEEHRDEALFSYALAVPGHITPKSANKFFDRIEEKAGGMTEDESESVAIALDQRLEREGYRAHFFPDDEGEGGHSHHAAPVLQDEPVRSDKIDRNEPCPCGSGKKYKKCCGA